MVGIAVNILLKLTIHLTDTTQTDIVCAGIID